MKPVIDSFSKVLESKVRLGVMSLLIVSDSMNFTTMKKHLHVTDGNLATHVAVLEKNRYVRVKKEFVGRKPLTTYEITDAGKKAFAGHINALEKIIHESRK